MKSYSTKASVKMDVEQQKVIVQTEEFVRSRLSGDVTGHDWWHVDRVRRTALALCHSEGGDPFLVELIALLHDVDDWKFREKNGVPGTETRQWLEPLGIDSETAEFVLDTIERISFKGANVADEMPVLEGCLVQDADRLDAIGAIGIARCFAYGGHTGQAIHDPEKLPQQYDSFEDYKTKSGSSLNHFYEKLLLLQDRMQTETACKIAAERHTFLEEFLKRFKTEWNYPE
ncbi:MAG TPA: HD domain-containing protein [Planctomycetaceae bacterium]|nr:HD domain-containing protein [Planctomycetaceae bacterium]